MNLFGEAVEEIDPDDELTDVPDEAAVAGLGGLLPPVQAVAFSGYEDIVRDVEGLIANNRLPHALMLTGIEGIGKSTFAFQLARRLLPGPSAARLISAGAHPDLLYVGRVLDEKKGRLKDTLGIDSIRAINPFMRKTTSFEGWRVAIVDDADAMTTEAQNALLKILEEPPQKALIVLIAHRPGRLVPTIRSRCRVVAFPAPGIEHFSALVKKGLPHLTAADTQLLYTLAGASVGQGLRLAEQGGLEMTLQLSVVLRAPLPWVEIHGMADTMGRAGGEDGYDVFRRLVSWIMAAVARNKAGLAALPSFLDSADFKAFAGQYALEEWLEICENMEAHFQTVEQGNLDRRQGVLGAFFLFKKTA